MSGRRVEWHATIDSTMRRAAELALEGAPAGTIVGASEQTAGQGRHGHAWYSAGGGLYFTLILRPRLEPSRLPVVTLALGLGVADAVQMFTGLPCDLRWPNDVLTREGKKLAGILTQYHDGAVLAGIGLNVNQADFPPELGGVATSLVLETGTEHDKHFLLRALAGSVEMHVKTLETSGADAILRLFSVASSYVSGRRVVVDLPSGAVRGTTAGLTPDGFLVLRKDDGADLTITAGGVRPEE